MEADIDNDYKERLHKAPNGYFDNDLYEIIKTENLIAVQEYI